MRMTKNFNELEEIIQAVRRLVKLAKSKYNYSKEELIALACNSLTNHGINPYPLMVEEMETIVSSVILYS